MVNFSQNLGGSPAQLPPVSTGLRSAEETIWQGFWNKTTF